MGGGMVCSCFQGLLLEIFVELLYFLMSNKGKAPLALERFLVETRSDDSVEIFWVDGGVEW